MDMTFTLGAIGSILTISGFGATILWQLRTIRRDGAADLKAAIQEAVKPLGDRMEKAEIQLKDYVPKQTLDEAFSGIKAHLLRIDFDFTSIREGHAAFRERLARQEQSSEGMVASISRLEQGVHSIDEKLDRFLERRN